MMPLPSLDCTSGKMYTRAEGISILTRPNTANAQFQNESVKASVGNKNKSEDQTPNGLLAVCVRCVGISTRTHKTDCENPIGRSPTLCENRRLFGSTSHCRHPAPREAEVGQAVCSRLRQSRGCIADCCDSVAALKQNCGAACYVASSSWRSTCIRSSVSTLAFRFL